MVKVSLNEQYTCWFHMTQFMCLECLRIRVNLNFAIKTKRLKLIELECSASLFIPHIQAKISLSVPMISWLTKVLEFSRQTSYSIQCNKCLAPATSDLRFFTVVSVFDLTVIQSRFQLPVKNQIRHSQYCSREINRL